MEISIFSIFAFIGSLFNPTPYYEPIAEPTIAETSIDPTTIKNSANVPDCGQEEPGTQCEIVDFIPKEDIQETYMPPSDLIQNNINETAISADVTIR